MTSFITSEEQRGDFYKTWAYENLQFNQRMRMKLQTGLQSQQQNNRLSRAAWLQARWLEISEQERRARLHNQKLLQDFQRAQDTLDDMVARTEAMNTIRVQYEWYLKENFPRWQQKLKDMQVSEQSKMEKDQDIKADITSQPVSSKSPDQSQFLCHNLLNTHRIGKDIRQNVARCKQDHQYPPATWLTDPQPLISGLQQNNIPKDYKNLHNTQALNHNFTPFYFLPCDSHHQSHSPVQQRPPSIDHIWQNPWVGVRQGLIPTGHFTSTGASWPRLPVINPVAWRMMDVPDTGGEKIQCSETDQENPTKEMLNPPKESMQRLKHKRRGGECDQPSELDCRPVHLLKDHKASEDSSVSFEVEKVSGCGMKHGRKKRRDGTQSYSNANVQESQCSSTVSQDAPLSASGGQTDPKRKENHQKPSAEAKMDTSTESINAENNVDGVIQDEKEESLSQESHPSSDKTDGTEPLNQKNSTEEKDTDEGENGFDVIAEEKISDRKVTDESEEEEGSEDEVEAGLDEAQGGEEERSERVVRNRDETDLSDEEERKKGDISSNIPDSDSEEGGEKTEGEFEENSLQDEQFEDAKGTQGRKDQNESEEEESDKIVDVQIHNNSLKQLHAADETEEEEVYNQEIEDDDEDDETVVKQAYLWSKYPLYDQTKCHDDDNEDIENVLKPQVNSQIHPEDDVEETKQPNDLLSDSGEEDTLKKTANEPVESDDEFDHFYD